MYDFNTIQTKFSPDDVEIFAPLNIILQELGYMMRSSTKDMVYRIYPSYCSCLGHRRYRRQLFHSGTKQCSIRYNCRQQCNYVGRQSCRTSWGYRRSCISLLMVISGHCHIHEYCWLGVNSTIRDITNLWHN